MNELHMIAQLILGTVFLFSALGKLKHPRFFAEGLEDYEILPAAVVPIAAWFIIMVESMLALTHLTGWWLKPSVLVGLGLLASFAIAVATNLRRGRALPCYCFGATGGEQISRTTLVRLVVLFSAEAFLFVNLSSFAGNRISHPISQSLEEFTFTLFWAAFLLVTVSWLLSLPDLTELLHSLVPQPQPDAPARATALPGQQVVSATSQRQGT